MNRIENYRFGKITINNQTYSKDLIIYPTKLLTNWWRKEGHSLHMEDLEEVFQDKPDKLIIGRGAQGVMKVPESVKSGIEKKGIEIIIRKTKSAIKLYNELAEKGENIAAALHLTC